MCQAAMTGGGGKDWFITGTGDTILDASGADYIQTGVLFPSTSVADQVCANFANDSTHAYLINIAEGTNATALNTFAQLGTVTTVDNCLYAPQTATVPTEAPAPASHVWPRVYNSASGDSRPSRYAAYNAPNSRSRIPDDQPSLTM